jgi:hypothetical protein
VAVCRAPVVELPVMDVFESPRFVVVVFCARADTQRVNAGITPVRSSFLIVPSEKFLRLGGSERELGELHLRLQGGEREG